MKTDLHCPLKIPAVLEEVAGGAEEKNDEQKRSRTTLKSSTLSQVPAEEKG